MHSKANNHLNANVSQFTAVNNNNNNNKFPLIKDEMRKIKNESDMMMKVLDENG